MDDFFEDLDFFFKRSSVRREDYTSLATITVADEYMKKNDLTRWVSSKYVTLLCLEQWENLKKCFLEFLPQRKNFKKEVEKTQRYLRIKNALSTLDFFINNSFISNCTRFCKMIKQLQYW